MAVEGKRVMQVSILHDEERNAIGKAPAFIGVAFEVYNASLVEIHRERDDFNARVGFDASDKCSSIIPSVHPMFGKVIKKFDYDKAAGNEFASQPKRTHEITRSYVILIFCIEKSDPKTRIDEEDSPSKDWINSSA
jgi:hypothetical protein